MSCSITSYDTYYSILILLFYKVSCAREFDLLTGATLRRLPGRPRRPKAVRNSSCCTAALYISKVMAFHLKKLLKKLLLTLLISYIYHIFIYIIYIINGIDGIRCLSYPPKVSTAFQAYQCLPMWLRSLFSKCGRDRRDLDFSKRGLCVSESHTSKALAYDTSCGDHMSQGTCPSATAEFSRLFFSSMVWFTDRRRCTFQSANTSKAEFLKTRPHEI